MLVEAPGRRRLLAASGGRPQRRPPVVAFHGRERERRRRRSLGGEKELACGQKLARRDKGARRDASHLIYPHQTARDGPAERSAGALAENVSQFLSVGMHFCLDPVGRSGESRVSSYVYAD